MRINIQLAILSILFFQLLSFDVSAKYVDATIYFPNGKEMKCQVDLPIKAAEKNIRIKKEGETKSDVVAADDIEMLLLVSNDQSVLLKRTKIKTFKMKGTKVSKYKAWLEVNQICDNIISYVGVVGYDVNRKGNLFGLAVDGMGGHYLQRPKESQPTEVGFVFMNKQITQKMIDKQRKWKLDQYFSNDKKAINHFKSKKRVTESEIIDYLNSICEEVKD